MNKSITTYIISLLTAFICSQALNAQTAQPGQSGTNANPASATQEKVKELDELIVESKYRWIDGDKFVFVPQKGERKHATDAASLIEAMDIPVLKANGSNITTRGGEAVSIFINGKPANEADMNTFWPQNALRVEYIQNSSDPRFLGASNVVNFIMKEYVVGGLTKLRAFQEIPNAGKYNAASKLVYRKMTYGLFVGGGYERDHQSSTRSDEQYHNLYYRDQFHDLITKHSSTDGSAYRSQKAVGSFNATYFNNKNIFANHSASISWNKNPGSYNHSSVIYNPAVLDAVSSDSYSSSNTLDFNLNGGYSFWFRSNSLSVNWSYTHGHHKFHSGYTEYPAPAIENNSIENLNKGLLQLMYNQHLTDKWALFFLGNGTLTWYSTRYTGSATSVQDLFRGNYSVTATSSFWPKRGVSFKLTTSINIYTTKANSDRMETEIVPDIFGTANYTFSQHNNGSFHISYSQSLPTSSQMADLSVRQTEFLWLEGNPGLKSYKDLSLSLNDTWMPVDLFSLYTRLSWSMEIDPLVYDYASLGTDADGLVKRYFNGKHNGRIYLNINPSLRLPKRFRIGAELGLSHYYSSYGNSLTHFRPQIHASWFNDYFWVGLDWFGKTKALANGGLTTVQRSSDLSVSVTYNWKNLNLTVSGNNLYHKHARKITDSAAGDLTSHSIEWSTGRHFNISLTYTFDYGKKVDPQINVGEYSESDTSVIGH